MLETFYRYLILGQGPVEVFRWLYAIGFLGIGFVQYAVATGVGYFLATWAHQHIAQAKENKKRLNLKAGLEAALARNKKNLEQIESELGNPHAVPFHPFDLALISYVAPHGYEIWDDWSACQALEKVRLQLTDLEAGLDLMRRSASDQNLVGSIRNRCRQNLSTVSEALREAQSAISNL
jgi:hypothetical protein